MAAVINRAGLGDNQVYEYCRSAGLEIFAEIPFDRQIAEAYSRGQLIPSACAQVKPLFLNLMDNIIRLGHSQKEACVA